MIVETRVVETRSEGAIGRLREAILTGELAAGSRLPQEELAARYGISRIPLREALRRLEGEGLVVITANRGAAVRALTVRDVEDIFDLRLALESLALRRASEQRADLREQTERLRERAGEAIAAGDLPALFHLDRDFHAGLTAASENAHLVQTLGGQWSQIMRIMHAYLRHANYPPRVWAEHQAIAAAVARGDADGAIALLTAHLDVARDRILADFRAGAAP